MLTEPQLDPSARWRARFRVTQHYTEIARHAPDRGFVVSNRTGVFQLYAWDVATNALRQLTHVPKGKPYGTLAPDGAFLYYHQDEDGNEIGHYVRVPFTGGVPEDITPSLPPYPSMGFTLSANGRRAALQIADQAGFHALLLDTDAAGHFGEPREIAAEPGFMQAPQLSYDGSLVSIGSSARANGRLHFSLKVLDTQSGTLVAELWDGPDTSISGAHFVQRSGDTRMLATSNRTGVARPLLWDPIAGVREDLHLDAIPGDLQIWDWSNDGRWVLLCRIQQATQHLYLYDLTQHTFQALAHPAGNYQGAYCANEHEIIAHWADATHPPQVIALDRVSGAISRVLFAPEDAPGGQPWRSVTFPSSDGQIIQGWLGLPEGSGPFPTILETHGGPTSVTTEHYSAGAQMWLDHGFAFLSINYRGSTTFGKVFEEQIWGDLGHWEVEDLAAAQAWLVQERIAQPDAILLTGWSYGGYLTLMGLGKRPDLWAGGMAGIAIADWSIQWEDTAPTLRGYQEALLGGTPQQNPEQYAKSSPISYVEQVRAPVMVIQGSNDTRCPARPMRMYEQKLQALGKQIEIEWFKAGHGSYDNEEEIKHSELMLRFAYRVLG
jgi:dienelactone hydrolase